MNTGRVVLDPDDVDANSVSLDDAEEIAEGRPLDEGEDLPRASSEWREAPPPVGSGHRLAQLLAWIWTQRDSNSVVQVHMKDGRTFIPTWFATELSQGDYGVFAGQDENDKYSLTLIDWAHIDRVDIKDLEVIPLEYFS